MKDQTFNYYKNKSAEERYNLSAMLRNQYFKRHKPPEPFYKGFNTFEEYSEWKNSRR